MTDFTEVSFAELQSKVDAMVTNSGHGHVHTATPGCKLIDNQNRYAVLLEDTDAGRGFVFYDDQPIEGRAKPLASLLHGAESVPESGESLDPASPAVEAMAELMRQGKGHFHVLLPGCLRNPSPGQWTIVFENQELDTVQEQISQERPLADIRLIESLTYR